jgi:hypothetical protein
METEQKLKSLWNERERKWKHPNTHIEWKPSLESVHGSRHFSKSLLKVTCVQLHGLSHILPFKVLPISREDPLWLWNLNCVFCSLHTDWVESFGGILKRQQGNSINRCLSRCLSRNECATKTYRLYWP